MNNLDNIGLDELDYDIQNHMKFSWFDTDAYKFNKDDNNGYVFGIVSWYGQYDLDTVADWYNSDGSDISWELNVYDDICDAMAEAARRNSVAIKWGAAWSEGDIRMYQGTAEDSMNAYIDLRRSEGRRPFIDAPHFEMM